MNSMRPSRIVIEDLPDMENLSPEELEAIFGAGRNFRGLNMESLEARSLMAASITATFAGNVLRIEGTPGADEVRILESGGRISVKDVLIQSSGNSVTNLSTSSIHRITVDGLEQTDDIWVGDGSKGLTPALEIIGSAGKDRLHSIDSIFAAGLGDGVAKTLQFNGATYTVGTDGKLLMNGKEMSFGGFKLSGASISVGDSGLMIDGFANIRPVGLVQLSGGIDTQGRFALKSDLLKPMDILGGMVKLKDSVVTLTADGAKLSTQAEIAKIGQAKLEGIVTFDGDYKLEGTGGIKLASQTYDGIHFVLGNQDVAFKVPVPAIGDVSVRGSVHPDGHWYVEGTYPETVVIGGIPFRNITVGLGDDRFAIGADSGVEGIVDVRIDGVMFFDGRFTVTGTADAISVGSFSLGKAIVVISNDPATTKLSDRTVQMTIDGDVGIPSGPTVKLHGVVDGKGNYDFQGDDNFEIGGLSLQETHFTLKKGEGFKLASNWNYGIFKAKLTGEITSGGKVTLEGDASTAKIGDLDLGTVHLKGEAEKGKFSFNSTTKTVSVGGFSLSDTTVGVTNRTANGAILTTVAGLTSIPHGPTAKIAGEVDTAGNYVLTGKENLKLAGITLNETTLKLEKGKGLQVEGKLNLLVFNSTVKGVIEASGKTTLTGAQSSAKVGGFNTTALTVTVELDPAKGAFGAKFGATADLLVAKVDLQGSSKGNAAGAWESLTLSGTASTTGNLAKIFPGNVSFTVTPSLATLSGKVNLPFSLGALTLSATVKSDGTITVGSQSFKTSSLGIAEAAGLLKQAGGSAIQVTGVLLGSFNANLEQVAKSLRDQNFSFSTIVDAIWEKAGKNVTTVAKSLKAANASFTTILSELWDKSGKSVSKMSSALSAVGASDAEIMRLLYDRGGDMVALAKALGKNVVVTINGVTKTWKASGERVEGYLNSAKNWVEETWGGGQQYMKNTWDKLGPGAKQLSRNILANNGQWSEEAWGGSQQYIKNTWDKLGSGAKQLSRNILAKSGQWSEEAWGGSQQYIKNTWDKLGSGAKQLSRNILAKRGQWSEEAWGGSQQYIKNTWDKLGSGGKQISRQILAKSGQWSEESWGGAQQYLKNTWDKLGSGAKQLSRLTLKTEGKWMEEYWNRGSDQYWRGIWSAAGSAGKMEERYVRRANERILETWNTAGDYGKTLYNSAGSVVSKTGSFFESVGKKWGLPW